VEDASGDGRQNLTRQSLPDSLTVGFGRFSQSAVRLIRRRLIVLVLAVIAGHVAGIAATPAVLCQMGGAAAARADEIVCTCIHGSNAECPMHKHKKAAPMSSETRWCTGCSDAPAAVLTTLMGVSGEIVGRDQPVAPEAVSESLSILVERPLNLVRPPVSPPPRG